MSRAKTAFAVVSVSPDGSTAIVGRIKANHFLNALRRASRDLGPDVVVVPL